jgi:hypothetical protein
MQEQQNGKKAEDNAGTASLRKSQADAPSTQRKRKKAACKRVAVMNGDGVTLCSSKFTRTLTFLEM